MIIVKVIGGLGNQMFQYAFAKRLAKERGVPFKLDTTEFETYPHHKYSLNHFTIEESYASKEEVEKFLKYPRKIASLPLFLQKTLKKLKVDETYLHLHRFYREPHYTFDYNVLEAKDATYFDGYWQSEKYFKEIREEILKDFCLKTSLGEYGKEIEKEIRSKKAPVCLHVRRGDFAKQTAISNFHGVTPLENYYAAVKILTEKISSPHFFIFSDSIDWAKENVKLGFPATFVGQGADKNYEELYLMTLCKHHILSNSTFGWWGAWLGETEGQIVIAPKKWFNKNISTKDLLPERWITL